MRIKNLFKIFGRDSVPILGFDVFISYSWTDGRAYAESLRDALLTHDLIVFLDDDRLNVGDPLTSRVSSALQKSRVLVLVTTPAALTSSYVTEELDEFSRRGKPLIPIAGKEVSDLLKNDDVDFNTLTNIENFNESQHQCAAKNLSTLWPFLHLVDGDKDKLVTVSNKSVEKILAAVGAFKAQRARQFLLVSLVLVFAGLAALAFVQRQEAISQKNVAELALEREKIERERAFNSLVRGVDQLDAFSEEVLQAISNNAISDPWPISIMQKLEDSYWGLANDDNLQDIRNTQFGIVFQKIAATYFRMGEREKSLSSFEKFVEFSRRIVERDKDNPAWRSALAAALLRLGNERALNGDLQGRIRDFTEAVQIYENLTDDPNTVKFNKERFSTGPELLALSQANFANSVLLLTTIAMNDRNVVSDALLEKALAALENAVNSGKAAEYVVRTNSDVGPKLRTILRQRP